MNKADTIIDGVCIETLRLAFRKLGMVLTVDQAAYEGSRLRENFEEQYQEVGSPYGETSEGLLEYLKNDLEIVIQE